MSQMTSLPTYNEIAKALETTQSDISPAEAHGLLCGIISVTAGRTPTSWEKILCGPSPDPESLALLQKLFASTHQQLAEFSFEFALFLPDEDADINTRAEALGVWCQGFLTGLEQGPTSIEADASDEAIDALNDITEIAQINYGSIADSDEDENSYAELVEYVRLAILMLYQEFKSEKKTENTDDNTSLH